MRWLKRKLVSWLLKDVEVEELVVKRLKVGEGTVGVDGSSITLPGLTADPTLAAGRVWFRSDLGAVRYSPDGTAVQQLARTADLLLSKLTIDTSKDWGGYAVKNIGRPAAATDAARMIDALIFG